MSRDRGTGLSGHCHLGSRVWLDGMPEELWRSVLGYGLSLSVTECSGRMWNTFCISYVRNRRVSLHAPTSNKPDYSGSFLGWVGTQKHFSNLSFIIQRSFSLCPFPSKSQITLPYTSCPQECLPSSGNALTTQVPLGPWCLL